MRPIDDFNASVPSNFNNSLDRAIPTIGTIVLAEFGLAVPRPGSTVLLDCTIGIRSFLGLPNILVSVLRDGGIIGSAQISTLAVNEIRLAAFQIVDSNAPVGYHAYTITAELLNPLLTQARVTGPLTFTGTTIGPVS
ncbi:hypothetical protein CHN50_04380 [Priestia aryabhattai]|uniref:hypothetical protein n=1 Tax=Bacillaceae TaxID=186817 RepID=UPI000BA016A8|nr:hypothetical protein [Bacillus sp. CBEL-1]OZT13809.1 hypothetical protein CHN50_04380 [Priestia aryabhattai]TDB49862.1 hypothetical protein EPL02_12315 [Bacillus sp. CBEL-1]USY53523.1 hypothetical protein NIZ91_12220 [Bacillus sp. 1780r2a1]